MSESRGEVVRVWVEAGAHAGTYLTSDCRPHWMVETEVNLNDDQRKIVATDGNGGRKQGVASRKRSGWVIFKPVEGAD